MLMQRIIEWIRKTLNRRRAAPVNTCQSSCSLERRLNEWTQKGLEAQTPATSNAAASMADTYHMILDVDRIIAEEFDRMPVLPENQ